MQTALDILNSCLRAVGERPVTEYNSNHPTALSARQTVEDTNQDFQSRGWWFNKEYKLKLMPLNTGEVRLPSETLEVTPTGEHRHLVRRDNKLYDPVKHTFNIGVPVTVNLTILIPVEDLPSSAFNYVKALSRYHFAVEEEVEEGRIQRYDREVLLKKTLMMNEELKQLDTNSNHRPVSAFLKLHMQPYGSMQYDATWPGGEPV